MSVRVEVKGCYCINSGRTSRRTYQAPDPRPSLVSDAASQRRSIVLEDGLAEIVAGEIGAGRATKTILVQSDAVRDHSSQIERYVTVDNHRFKSDLLLERAERYGVNVARAITCDATLMEDELDEELFDVVFIDAPCTGLGTLRRHPEIRWRLTDQAVVEHAELNARLLKSAARCVAPEERWSTPPARSLLRRTRASSDFLKKARRAPPSPSSPSAGRARSHRSSSREAATPILREDEARGVSFRPRRGV